MKRNYRNQEVVDFQGRSKRQVTDNEKMGGWVVKVIVVTVIGLFLLGIYQNCGAQEPSPYKYSNPFHYEKQCAITDTSLFRLSNADYNKNRTTVIGNNPDTSAWVVYDTPDSIPTLTRGIPIDKSLDLFDYLNTPTMTYVYDNIVTIQNLIDYQKQCYDDSTKLYEWKYWNGMRYNYCWLKSGEDSPYFETIGLTGNFKYIHKTPDFNEFLNFMIDKSKQ